MIKRKFIFLAIIAILVLSSCNSRSSIDLENLKDRNNEMIEEINQLKKELDNKTEIIDKKEREEEKRVKETIKYHSSIMTSVTELFGVAQLNNDSNIYAAPTDDAIIISNFGKGTIVKIISVFRNNKKHATREGWALIQHGEIHTITGYIDISNLVPVPELFYPYSNTGNIKVNGIQVGDYVREVITKFGEHYVFYNEEAFILSFYNEEISMEELLENQYRISSQDTECDIYYDWYTERIFRIFVYKRDEKYSSMIQVGDSYDKVIEKFKDYQMEDDLPSHPYFKNYEYEVKIHLSEYEKLYIYSNDAEKVTAYQIAYENFD